jgi:hypothetical protein
MTEIKIDATKVAFLAAFAYVAGKGLEFVYLVIVALMVQYPSIGGM